MNQATLADRVTRLEQEDRRLRRAGVLGAVVVAAVLIMGQTLPSRPARVLEAQEFVLREPNGTVRARLAVEPQNHSGLSLYDKTGTRVVDLGVLPHGSPGLHLQAKDSGKSSVGLEVHNGNSLVSLTDKEGKTRAGLAVGSDGVPSLLFFDQDEKPRAAIRLELDGSPRLRLLDSSGRETPVAGSGHWVLWLQIIDSTKGATRNVAAGAWSTRDECERERQARTIKAPPTPTGSNIVPALVCLPDTVNLIGERR